MITVSNGTFGIHRERILFSVGLGKCLGRAEKKEAVKYGQGIASFI